MTMSETPAHLGRYEILGGIGHGGFATVYRARDAELERIITLRAYCEWSGARLPTWHMRNKEN